ncbi:MAG: hypothetical protein CBC35_10190 [Planctomycetes bacterium TMED75]|nr:hypothetical protein [Planctomycetaceae bacterium]OUU91126.1 MAG: hypothetical protein CBC35_10190 [Planctomycetes bacterium TMED75]
MFATPWLALAGILAMAIPIVIHLLFRRRRKPVNWGAMRLLIEAINRNRRRSRIQNILLLVTRCLVLLLVGSALARPFFSGSGLLGGDSRTAILIIDDGLISGLDDGNGRTELDLTIESAIELIGQLEVGDRVSIISSSTPARELTDGPTLDFQRATNILKSLTPGSGATDVSSSIQIASTIIEEMDSNASQSVLLLGQWRKGSLSTLATSVAVNPFQMIQESNQSIDLLISPPTTKPTTVTALESISIRRPVDSTFDERPEIRSTISLVRLGNDLDSINSTIRVSGDGVEETLPKPIKMQQGSTRSVVEMPGRLDPTGSALDGTSSITVTVDDPSLPLVSRRSLSVNTSPRIRVGIIDRENFYGNNALNEVPSSEWIKRSLEPEDDGQIQVDFLDPASISERSLSRLDMLIITRPDLLPEVGWNLLHQIRRSGTAILVVPPEEAQVHSWMDLFTKTFEIDSKFELGVVIPDQPLAMSDQQPGGSLLSAIDSDLDDLSGPIEIRRLIRVDAEESDARIPLVSEAGDPILLVWEPVTSTEGVLALFTVPPQMKWTSLPVKPLMVPLFQEIVRQGTASSQSALNFVPGDTVSIPVIGSRQIRHSSGYTIELDASGRPEIPLTQTGTWDVLDSSGGRISTMVVNVDLAASDPSLISTQQLTERIEPYGAWTVLESSEMRESITQSTTGSRVSLILLAIGFSILVLETILNRALFRERLSIRRSTTVEGLSS